jgi:hypothetical protein
MNEDEALTTFGLPSSHEDRGSILAAIKAELMSRDADVLVLKCLCIQLFSLGRVEDCLTVWRVKRHSFDLGCSIDVQLLCGAGLAETQSYLSGRVESDAVAVRAHLEMCVQSGDFHDWIPAKSLEWYRSYYFSSTPPVECQSRDHHPPSKRCGTRFIHMITFGLFRRQ